MIQRANRDLARHHLRYRTVMARGRRARSCVGYEKLASDPIRLGCRGNQTSGLMPSPWYHNPPVASLGLEPISHPEFHQKVPRLRRFGFEFVSRLPHVDPRNDARVLRAFRHKGTGYFAKECDGLCKSLIAPSESPLRHQLLLQNLMSSIWPISLDYRQLQP